MEKADNALVIEASFDWDDVGSWNALARHEPSDENGNVVLAGHAGIDTAGCILVGEKDHTLATLGVRDLIVVQTPDATLICDRDRAGDVKTLVNLLKEAGMDRLL